MRFGFSHRTTARTTTGLASAALLALALFFPHPSSAQQPDDEGPRWSLGAGLVASPSPYVGVEAELIPLPFVGLDWRRLYIEGVRAGYAVAPPDGPWRFDLVARIRFQGYDADDSSFLLGMEDRDDSIDAGLLLGWRGERWSTELVLVTDVLDESNGQEAILSLARRFEIGRRLRLAPEAGISWQSRDLVDHYYGVRESEARIFRPAYQGRSVLNGLVGLEGGYHFSRRLTLLFALRTELLDGEIEDSPIVDEDTALSGLIGLAWQL